MMEVQGLYDAGKYEEVISRLQDSEPNELLAFAYQKSKKWEDAMNIWNLLIVASPQNADYYNERGVCKFNLRFKHSIQDFDKAIELEPTNSYFYSCRAYIKDKLGDSEGSVVDYTKALELDPEDAITLNNLGLAEQKIGYTARARERFKDSDDLLGIKTIDSREDLTENGIGSTPSVTSSKPSVWQEFKKMLSIKGFKDFLRDLKAK
ncbi:tetratricopeptide repeat protein [Bacteroidia bacterium]|nr:tetratricopeptide repeat protein [Bacteroidia bacterium]